MGQAYRWALQFVTAFWKIGANGICKGMRGKERRGWDSLRKVGN